MSIDPPIQRIAYPRERYPSYVSGWARRPAFVDILMEPLISKFVANPLGRDPHISEYDIIRIEAFAVQIFAALGAGRSSHDIDLARLLRGVEVLGREEDFLYSVKIMTTTQFDIHKREWDFEPASPLELISLRHFHYKTGFFNMNEEYKRLRTEFKKTNNLHQIIRSHAAFGLGIGLYYPEFLIPSIDVDTLDIFPDHDEAGKRNSNRNSAEIKSLVLASLCAFEVVPQLAKTLRLEEFIQRWAPDRYSQVVIHMNTQDQNCLPRRLERRAAVNVMMSSTFEAHATKDDRSNRPVSDREISNPFTASLIRNELEGYTERPMFGQSWIRNRELWGLEIGMINVGLCIGVIARMFEFDHELFFLLFDIRPPHTSDLLGRSRHHARRLIEQHKSINQSAWLGKYQELSMQSAHLLGLQKIMDATDHWRGAYRMVDFKEAVKLLNDDGFDRAMRFIDEQEDLDIQAKDIMPKLLDAFALGLGIEVEYPEKATTLLLHQSFWRDNLWELGRNTYEHYEYRYNSQPSLDKLMTHELIDRVTESLARVKSQYPELNRKLK